MFFLIPLVVCPRPLFAEQVHTVASIVFQYIRMLVQEGPQEWVFDELATVAKAEFEFREKTNAMNFVSSLASGLHVCVVVMYMSVLFPSRVNTPCAEMLPPCPPFGPPPTIGVPSGGVSEWSSPVRGVGSRSDFLLPERHGS